MTDLEIQALKLFELTPSSSKYLWLIASNWLEENGLDEITVDIFRKQIDLVNIFDKSIPDAIEFSLCGPRMVQFGRGRSCGYGGNTYSYVSGVNWSASNGHGSAGIDSLKGQTENVYLEDHINKYKNVQKIMMNPMFGLTEEI